MRSFGRNSSEEAPYKDVTCPGRMKYINSIFRERERKIMKKKWKKVAAAACTAAIMLSSLFAGSVFAEEDFSAGQTLIVGLQGDPSSFNQVGNPDDWGYVVSENIFSRLVKLNSNGEVLPDLAQSWEVAEDGLTYTFHLAENAVWHDGEAVTSADVVWTFEQIMEQSAYLSSYLGSVESFEATDEHTVVFHMTAPDSALLSNISFLGATILPEHVFAGEEDWLACDAATSAPVGCGPFKLAEYNKGVSITLEANPDYFGQVPAYDKLVYQIIPDSNTAIQAFGNGEIDVLGVMPAGSQITTLKNTPDTVVTSTPNFGRYYYGYNFKSEALADVNVRMALTMAIDRQEIVDKAYGESGVLAEGYYTPAVEWAYNADAAIPACDKAKAEELLQAAGLEKDSDGYYLHLSLATFNLDPFLNFSQIMKANLEEVGVDLTINTLDAGAFMELGYSGEGYDLYAMGGQVGPDPSMFFHRIGTGGMMNFSNYSNEEADGLFATAASSNDQEERAECYKKIQEICAEDMIIVPVAEDIAVNAYKDYLTGLPYDTAADRAAQTEFTYVTFTRNPF